MRRRAFIAALAGAASLPLAARAQQDERLCRIGVLSGLTVDEVCFAGLNGRAAVSSAGTVHDPSETGGSALLRCKLTRDPIPLVAFPWCNRERLAGARATQ